MPSEGPSRTQPRDHQRRRSLWAGSNLEERGNPMAAISSDDFWLLRTGTGFCANFVLGVRSQSSQTAIAGASRRAFSVAVPRSASWV